MQVNSPASSRASWYDRNPKTIWEQIQSSDIAPHANTVRFIYTVPSARKCKLEAAYLFTERRTAASTAGDQYILFFYAANTSNDAHLARVDNSSNTLGVSTSYTTSLQIVMQENDQFYVEDGDNSIGGTGSFEETFKGTEFDA